MTPLLTKWRETEEDFDNKLSELDGLGIGLDVRYLRERLLKHREELKSFHRQSLIAIIEGEIARLEKELAYNMETQNEPAEAEGYRQCLRNQISYYQSTLEGFKK